MNIFITQPIDSDALNRLRNVATVNMFQDSGRVIGKSELIEGVKSADILYCLLHDRIDAEVLEAGQNLKMVADAALFPFNVDLEVLKRRRIPVTGIPNIVAKTTADLQWGLLLAVARRIVFADKALRKGLFPGAQSAYFVGGDVHEKTVGTIGLGAIGRGIAERASGFGMRVLYNKRTRLNREEEAALEVTYCDLDDLLRQSDFICVNVPLTEETHYLIGRRELELMKRSAYLINTSRGPVLDENALVKGLKDGQIAGAALDVYEQEPKVHPELVDMDNVVLTPHIGSAGYDTRAQIHSIVTDNIEAFLKGVKPPNLCNPEVWMS